MVRKYKKKGMRTQEVDKESMNLAIDDVIQGRLSYRKAALKYNIKTSTLESRVKKFKDGTNDDRPSRTFHSKFTSLQVFSLEEDDYIINCSKMHYGLTTVQIRKLAYEYPKALNFKYPAKWDENQMAGLEWMRKYRERNSNELEERHRQKEFKKIEQGRKARAKAMKRSLLEVNSRQKKKKAKKMESDEDSEESEGSQISLRESSTSPVDLEIDEDADDCNTNTNFHVTPEKIKDNCYVLVNFEKKTSFVYYVGKVLSLYSRTELEVSYLR